MNGHSSETLDYKTRIPPLCNPGTTNVCSPACEFHATGFWDACQEAQRELTGGNPANTPIFIPPQRQTLQLRAECRKHKSWPWATFPPLKCSHTSWRPVFACRCLGKVVPSYLLHAFAVQVFCSCHSSKIVRLSCCLENMEHPVSFTAFPGFTQHYTPSILPKLPEFLMARKRPHKNKWSLARCIKTYCCLSSAF